GFLTDLNVIQQPYTQGQIANSLTKINDQFQQGTLKPTFQDRWMLDLLAQEYKVRTKEESTEQKLIMQPGIWADQSIHYDAEDTKIYTGIRSQAGVGFAEKLCFYNGIRLDQALVDDPNYAGRKWNGLAAYTEQAYLRYSAPRFELTLGRDFLNWGSGRTGRLLFSDHAQPLDQLKINFNYKALSFTALAVDLDQWELSDSLVAEYRIKKANRFLTSHRLTINLFNTFYIGFTEALVYGGPHSSWELKYHNPLLYYHGELLNHGGYDGNGLLYLDFDCYPWRNWQFYGEILIDDFQLEKSEQVDLEPNQIGMIFGFRHAGIFGWQGSTIGLEYIRIANRTYNSWQEWEKFVHFNKTIGYELGNNFDRWNMIADWWLMNGLQLGLECDIIRKGEGSVLDPWDAPWENFTVAQGYHEAFPYGVIERSTIFTMKLKYHFARTAIIESQISYRNITNFFHIPGKDHQGWSGMIKLHWHWTTDCYY
ncbi:MAG: capsule assembly Wzi family protein, partial [bacterium]|nr:capsule assembly Wzi family protein [bacterium]